MTRRLTKDEIVEKMRENPEVNEALDHWVFSRFYGALSKIAMVTLAERLEYFYEYYEQAVIEVEGDDHG